MKKRRIGIRIENNKVYMGSNYHVGVACIGELCKWKDLDVGDYFQPIRSRNKKAYDGVSEKRVNKENQYDGSGIYVDCAEVMAHTGDTEYKGIPYVLTEISDDNTDDTGKKKIYVIDDLGKFRDTQLLGNSKYSRFWEPNFFEYDMCETMVVKVGSYYSDPLIKSVRSGKTSKWINHLGNVQSSDRELQRDQGGVA